MRERMRELIDELKKASYAYYQEDNLLMFDKEYDDKCEELERLEKETGIIMSDSPLYKVGGFLLEQLEKVKHSKPMLSADKTKEVKEVVKFCQKGDVYCSYKLDGLTIVLKYNNGELITGVTRGRNGEIGEDVTHNCRFLKNIPLHIPYKDYLELRGECLISWNEFERINNNSPDKLYQHPRGLAAGTIRNLNTEAAKNREIKFYVFESVTDLGFKSKLEGFEFLESIGFECVERELLGDPSEDSIKRLIERFSPSTTCNPVDGIMWEYNDIDFSKSLGATGHHENCRLALKPGNDTYETILRDIEWSCSKNKINPVAIFDTVNINGSDVSRASVHNISIMRKLKLCKNSRISVYLANMIIPQIDENYDTDGELFEIPYTCPSCGGKTEIRKIDNTETLHCTNPNCTTKLIKRLEQFCSKDGLDITGLSIKTIEKFVELGYLKNYYDIYKLHNYENQILVLDGFEKKSCEKLFKAIENSKNTFPSKFLFGLGIDGIGKHQSKIIMDNFGNNYEKFKNAIKVNYCFDNIKGIGEIINYNIYKWWREHYEVDCISELESIMRFKTDDISMHTNNPFVSGKTFCITGSLIHFENRNELVKNIESKGGRVAGSVSKSTDYLINNDKGSQSSKNKKANQLGVKIISEDDYLELNNQL